MTIILIIPTTTPIAIYFSQERCHNNHKQLLSKSLHLRSLSLFPSLHSRAAKGKANALGFGLAPTAGWPVARLYRTPICLPPVSPSCLLAVRLVGGNKTTIIMRVWWAGTCGVLALMPTSIMMMVVKFDCCGHVNKRQHNNVLVAYIQRAELILSEGDSPPQSCECYSIKN